MLSISRVEVRAYSRATEVVDRVKTAVLNLYPVDFREDIKITTTNTTSHSKTPIAVITAVTQVKRIAEETLTHILTNLSNEDKIMLKNTLDQRVNEKCVLFVRIDKQAALLGKVSLAKNPDLMSVKVYLTMYPRCKRDFMITRILNQLHIEGE